MYNGFCIIKNKEWSMWYLSWEEMFLLSKIDFCCLENEPRQSANIYKETVQSDVVLENTLTISRHLRWSVRWSSGARTSADLLPKLRWWARMTTSARPALSICSRFKRPKPWPNDIEPFRIIYRWKGMEVYFLLQFMEWHFDVCRKRYGQLSDQRSYSDDSCDALF